MKDRYREYKAAETGILPEKPCGTEMAQQIGSFFARILHWKNPASVEKVVSSIENLPIDQVYKKYSGPIDNLCPEVKPQFLRILTGKPIESAKGNVQPWSSRTAERTAKSTAKDPLVGPGRHTAKKLVNKR